MPEDLTSTNHQTPSTKVLSFINCAGLGLTQEQKITDQKVIRSKFNRLFYFGLLLPLLFVLISRAANGATFPKNPQTQAASAHLTQPIHAEGGTLLFPSGSLPEVYTAPDPASWGLTASEWVTAATNGLQIRGNFHLCGQKVAYDFEEMKPVTLNGIDLLDVPGNLNTVITLLQNYP